MFLPLHHVKCGNTTKTDSLEGWAPPLLTPEARWDGLILYPTQDQQAASTRHSTTGTSWFLGQKQKNFAGREFLAEKQHWSVCLTTIVCQIHGCTLFIVHALRNDSIRNPVILRIFSHLHAICKLPTCNVFWEENHRRKNYSTCQPASVLQSPSHYFLEWTWHTKIPAKFEVSIYVIGDGHPTFKYI